MTFTIQRSTDGATALGGDGSDLGYAGITPSVAVGLNLYQNPGVNLFRDGSTTPVDSVSYNFLGTHFEWVNYSAAKHKIKVYVADTNTQPATPLLSDKINLEAVLGGHSFAGFTGGTGSSYAAQDVHNWTLTNPKRSNGRPALGLG